MTPTPRTDAFEAGHNQSPDTIGFGFMKALNHARQLERELIAKTEALEKLQAVAELVATGKATL